MKPELAVQAPAAWRLRLPGLRLALVAAIPLLALLPGCRPDPQAAALKQLAARGYSLSVEEFFRAARSDDPAAIQLFTEAGLEPGIVDAKGHNAVREAAAAGKPKALEKLIRCGARLPTDKQGATSLLNDAVRSHEIAVLRALLDAGVKVEPDVTDPPLVLAAKEKLREMVDLLAPLSPGHEQSALFAAAANGEVSVISSLLKAGASVFHREAGTLRTPLAIAVANGHAGAVELLLASGSDRLTLDAKGQSPLEMAQDLKLSALISRLSADPTPEERLKPDPIKNLTLNLGRTVEVAPEQQLIFMGLQEEMLPYSLSEVSGSTAVIEAAGSSKPITISLEEPIPGTAWKLEKVTPTGMFFQPCAVLRERNTANRVLLVKTLPTRYGQRRAWIKFEPGDQKFEASEGDHFTLNGKQPLGLVVERLTAMELTLADAKSASRWTLKLGGVR